MLGIGTRMVDWYCIECGRCYGDCICIDAIACTFYCKRKAILRGFTRRCLKVTRARPTHCGAFSIGCRIIRCAPQRFCGDILPGGAIVCATFQSIIPRTRNHAPTQIDLTRPRGKRNQICWRLHHNLAQILNCTVVGSCTKDAFVAEDVIFHYRGVYGGINSIR